MPLLTTVIDDKSPLITYDSTWILGMSEVDPSATAYYLGTFQVCATANGMAKFSFNGTNIWIYGSKRVNHGNFMVSVDEQGNQTNNGNVNVDMFQQLLYASTPLGQGMHQMTFVDLGPGATGGVPYVDIDMIVWESEVGNTGDQLVGETVPDTDPRFQYGGSAWSTTSGSTSINVNLFNNGTGHITQTPNASVTFTFQVCEAVTLFGTSGSSNGRYTAQLDGGQTLTYNAAFLNRTNYGVAIYHADNLGPGSHQVVLTNLAANPQALSIDYAQLWTTTSSASTTGNISPGTIAGLVVEGVVAILAGVTALFFYWRWKETSNALSSLLDRPSMMMSGMYAPAQRLGDGTVTGSMDRPIASSDAAPTTSDRSNNHVEAFPLLATGHEVHDSGREQGDVNPKYTRRNEAPRNGARPVSSVTSDPAPPDYYSQVAGTRNV